MARLLRLLVAWVAGCVVYVVAALLWNEGDLASLLLVPVGAVVVSTLALGLVLAAGLVLRVGPLGRLWHAHPAGAVALVVGCLAVMAFGSTAGLTFPYADPDTGRAFPALHPAPALASYALLLFALAHWPTRRAVTPAGADGRIAAIKNHDEDKS